jgi:hypothetical protein
LICSQIIFLSQFKSTSNKNVSVVGWMVMMADDPEHPDLFLLTDSEKGELLERPGVKVLCIHNF